ncbi:hypothetical protein NST38_31255 [Paenibacillus sp. FSL H8-0104]|uniref:hypothetical protein n=1 Tax=Paenibacillus sp. FSL H8-0104 TaxID=2954509 RepID=UPI0030FD3037
MMWYQVIEIRNLEPLKIGAGGNKAHWDEPCKDYIPGSTLRGGVIARMQRLGLFGDPKSILQHMECSNAYLYQNGQLYLPSPQHLRMDKHKYRRQRSLTNQGDVNRMVDLTNLYTIARSEGMSEDNQTLPKNQLPQSYVTIRDGYMEGIKPSKNYRLHHSSLLNKDKQERANLFSYQALEPGHIFRSVIGYPEGIRSQIESMWNGSDIWYLGGSKGSGYGRCQVRPTGKPKSDYTAVCQQLGINVSQSEADSSEELNVLTLTCLSDLIVRGRYGEPLPYLPEEVLERYGGIKIKRITDEQRHFVQTGLTEGYNATWKARYPKETTIKAGSVMRYQMDGHVDEQTRKIVIAALEQRRYGARTQEGYGWIAVNLPYPSQLRVQSIPAVSGESREDSVQIQDGKSKHMIKDETSSDTKSASANALHIAESIRLISKGLGDNRLHWLRILAKNMGDTSKIDGFGELKVNNLKSHHCQVMIDLLKRWLNIQSKSEFGFGIETNTVRKQTYRQNKQFFSLEGVHFDGILKFLKNDQVGPEHEGLSRLAATKLNSSHGRIYYMAVQTVSDPNMEEIMRQKHFIAELICEALEIYKMSTVGEAIPNEH